ncbi:MULTISPECIES: tRNA uracil 4-sulfurtransferase ThiI [Bacillaceae]|uniref:Probable tRNA sulfurtransferase n=1 Tax=Gottfriedia luciferensis TaxID=178774 RepID=A0ABX2ZPX3_9BACI|nr:MULTISPECIES: tRNA uracil 4-sulfurtransferase ThiI [Bacillaceae]ODG90760.1 tRNA 4-thiouridine(8) synthase ThiI [Gottfriedia luciferensis]PGZ90517.1 tRNA 4-thiouridine(8) synthase ThiI [Bacillus sp. AFS029533]SFD28009.1 thiamine biosynthesis protein ThiI [Bacillus sp. UNCCL81]
MNVEYILIRYGEMTTKGKNRGRFTSILRENVRNRLKAFEKIKITATRDRMYIKLNGEDHEKVAANLKEVFGIHTFSYARKVDTELDAIKKGALEAINELGDSVKTFKVNVQRSYKQFPLNTPQLNRELGGYILQNTEHLTVDVHQPDVAVRVEVRDDATYITCGEEYGAGGYPVGVGGKVMLLLSGGIDSPVAAYMLLKRGVSIEAIHFESPPFTSDRAKQKVIDLASKLTRYCRRVTLHVIPFTEIQKAIHKEMPASYTMTIMRRVMLRIAEQVSVDRKALALATGESLGQVASQTLESMHTINEVTNYPVLRPLLAMDKLEIMDIAKKIDTYDISIRPYEDCCTIFTPANPTTKPKRDKVARYESRFDFTELINEAVVNRESIIFENEMIRNQSSTKEEEIDIDALL